MRSQSNSFKRSALTALPVFLKLVHRRTLWTLYLGNLLTALGSWFFLLLPPWLCRLSVCWGSEPRWCLGS
jgi:hypothetical protein